VASEVKKMSEATDPRRRFGDRGENLAAVFFTSKGFRVLERNWRCRLGEIDLILEHNGMIHFVEVKTRRTETYGHPEESITRTKLSHFSKAIEVYLQASKVPISRYQADALAILKLPGKPAEFHYIESVL
jgi:putative endonuclease